MKTNPLLAGGIMRVVDQCSVPAAEETADTQQTQVLLVLSLWLA